MVWGCIEPRALTFPQDRDGSRRLKNGEQVLPGTTDAVRSESFVVDAARMSGMSSAIWFAVRRQASQVGDA